MNNPGSIARIELKFQAPSKPALSTLYTMLPQHLLLVFCAGTAETLNASRKRLADNLAHFSWDEVEAAAREAYQHKKASWAQSLKQRGNLTDEVFEAEFAKIGKYHVAASNYASSVL